MDQNLIQKVSYRKHLSLKMFSLKDAVYFLDLGKALVKKIFRKAGLHYSQELHRAGMMKI